MSAKRTTEEVTGDLLFELYDAALATESVRAELARCRERERQLITRLYSRGVSRATISAQTAYSPAQVYRMTSR